MKFYPSKKELAGAWEDTLSYTREHPIATLVLSVWLFLTLFSGAGILFADFFWAFAVAVEVFLITCHGNRRYFRYYLPSLKPFFCKFVGLLLAFYIGLFALVFANTSTESNTAEAPQEATQTTNIPDNQETNAPDSLILKTLHVIGQGIVEGFTYFWYFLLTLLMGIFRLPFKHVFLSTSSTYFALALSGAAYGAFTKLVFTFLTGFAFLIGWPVIQTVASIFLIHLMIEVLGLPRKPRKKKVKKEAKARTSSIRPVHSSV